MFLFFDAISINPGFVWFVKLKKIESYRTNSCGRIHVFCLYFLFALSIKHDLQHYSIKLFCYYWMRLGFEQPESKNKAYSHKYLHGLTRTWHDMPSFNAENVASFNVETFRKRPVKMISRCWQKSTRFSTWRWRHIMKTHFEDMWRHIVWRHIVWWRRIFLWRHILALHCLAPHCLVTPHFPVAPHFGAALFGATLLGDATFSCDATFWRHIVWRHIVWWRHIFLWRHILAPHSLATHCLVTPHWGGVTLHRWAWSWLEWFRLGVGSVGKNAPGTGCIFGSMVGPHLCRPSKLGWASWHILVLRWAIGKNSKYKMRFMVWNYRFWDVAASLHCIFCIFTVFSLWFHFSVNTTLDILRFILFYASCSTLFFSFHASYLTTLRLIRLCL